MSKRLSGEKKKGGGADCVRAPLIRHGLDKSQSFNSCRANVIHPAVPETPDGGALVGGNQLPAAPEHKMRAAMAMSGVTAADHSAGNSLLEECELQGHLYKCVRTHFLLLDQFFSITFEGENVHVQIVHQPGGKPQDTRVPKPVDNRSFTETLPLHSLSGSHKESLDLGVTFPSESSWGRKLSAAGWLGSLCVGSVDESKTSVSSPDLAR